MPTITYVLWDLDPAQLPGRILILVQERAMIHTEELLEDWRLCRENSVPAKIAPLP
jgi:hypothetical protein